jgi:hypothetical protein
MYVLFSLSRNSIRFYFNDSATSGLISLNSEVFTLHDFLSDLKKLFSYECFWTCSICVYTARFMCLSDAKTERTYIETTFHHDKLHLIFCARLL